MITLFYHSKPIHKTIREMKSLSGVWIHAENPSEEEIEELYETLHLEKGHLTDALDPHESPRFEQEGDDLYVYTRMPLDKEGVFITVPILFILKKKTLITVFQEKVPNSFFDRALKTPVNKEAFSITLCFRLFAWIIESYYTAIAMINKRVMSVSANVDRIENKDIIQFVAYEHILNEMLNAVIQTNLILKNLLATKKWSPVDFDKDQLEDLFLSTGQLIDYSKSSLFTVKNMRDAYSAILTNNLNRIIKFFTTLTIILMIPTIIASFYGMNVTLPLAGHPFAFGIIFLFTTAMSLLLLIFFQKRRLL